MASSGDSAELVAELREAYAPLARFAAERHDALGRPLVLGVSGAQGTGKSTLSALLTPLLAEDHGLRAVGFSLDDLYLDGARREALARDVHPLLRTRGVPGTHDVALGHAVLDALTRGEPGRSTLPAFDKARDEPLPAAERPVVDVPADIVVLEGWCVGARPEPDAALSQPINALERARDPEGRWRRHVNAQLAGPYAALFARLDALIFLEAPDIDCVRRWRTQQERALSRRLRREGRPDSTMSPAEIDVFVQHFERLTRTMLDEMPRRADVVVELDRAHRVVGFR